MNEIEKAIKAFGIALEAPLAEHLSIPAYAIIEPAVLTALAALREQAEREKGCDLCMPVNTMKSMGAYGRKFMYCPMCGKRLEATNER